MGRARMFVFILCLTLGFLFPEGTTATAEAGEEGQEDKYLLESLDLFIRKKMEEQDWFQTTVYENFHDIRERLNDVYESQNILQQEVQELQERITIMEERDVQRDLWNKTCSVDDKRELQNNFSTEFQRMQESIQGCLSAYQLSNLVMLFAKDVDECNLADNRCHDHAQCQNTFGNYSCTCNTGFSGNGFSCEDVDECSTGDNLCHDLAQCTNNVGNYSCTCNPGFSGDGFSCALECVSPSQLVPKLGCITPIEKKMNWEAAKENCLQQNSRLLEGLTSQNELDELKKRFNTFLSGTTAWLGIFKWIWVETGEPIEPSTLWKSTEPHRGNQECGFVELGPSRPDLRDWTCSQQLHSFCQIPSTLPPV